MYTYLLPSLVSVKATEVCIPVGNDEVLLAAVYKSPGLKIVQRHIRERYLLNANQFGFHTIHSTTLQCIRLTDYVILNFNKSTAAIFLDIEKAFDTTWHIGLVKFGQAR
jgi:hypothetical protein